jgi:hypothetical protein
VPRGFGLLRLASAFETPERLTTSLLSKNPTAGSKTVNAHLRLRSIGGKPVAAPERFKS